MKKIHVKELFEQVEAELRAGNSDAVSKSLTSPTRITSGSCLKIDRKPLAKVYPASEST